VNLAAQINDTIYTKKVTGVTAGHTPHKFAWYYGDKSRYPELLIGKKVGKARGFGGWVEIEAEQSRIVFGEGVGIRFHDKGETHPDRHQLLVEFSDGFFVSATVQMYGGLGVISGEQFDNPYYKVAREKPSPLSPSFDEAYFDRIISAPEATKLSLKALLATEQRMPGLGNGVLQDILFNAKMHPKKKVAGVSSQGKQVLFNALRSTLSAMVAQGGRDTELDLFGRPGGYQTVLSKNTVGKPCPVCGTAIKKESYMGGSIYYCDVCQPIQ